MQAIKIKDRFIGAGHPCYVIAEMSANHGGSFDRALAILRAAKEAGADAVKLQTYTADTLTINCDKEYFQLGEHPLWGRRTLYQLYQQAYTPWEWHKPLKDEAEALGLHLFSTPFDETSVDFLEGLDVPAYKIASFELLDDPLLMKIASMRKPVILSTGMATFEEVRHAVDLLRAEGTKELALLRCVSSYPARAEEMNLRLIPDLRCRFDAVVGLSDHTVDSTTAVAAVALGASIVEKHIKLSDQDKTFDSEFSLSAGAFRRMVDDIRAAEKALGEEKYGPTRDEKKSLLFRRSIFVVEDVRKGEVFTGKNVRIIRPGYGMSPVSFQKILGKRATRDFKRGMPLTEDCVES
jgi:pseudaminic acid synthase